MIARIGRTVLALIALLASLVGATDLAAQRVGPLARPMQAYNDLDYDVAATGFRTALALEGAARLADADRLRALMHLGATEVFRSRRDAAVQAFRSLLLLDPRYRPDIIVFPPEVSTLFQESRMGVRAASVVVPAFVDIRTVADRFPIRVFSASLHDVRATITDGLGAPVRVLYDGAVGDSLELLWNGRDGLGRLREAGRYRLRVTSRSPEGRDERDVEIPLQLLRVEADTLPTPAQLPPSAFRPESLVASGGKRLLGAGGLFGMTRASRPIPIGENIAYNREQRAAWSREVERVRIENEVRRAAAGLRITTGPAVVVMLP